MSSAAKLPVTITAAAAGRQFGNDLPVEILSYIFELVICPVPGSERGRFTCWAFRSGFTRQHATLLSICAYWRVTALECSPRIWTMLRFDPKRYAAENPYQIENVVAMLDRSKEYPFSIVIGIPRGLDRGGTQLIKDTMGPHLFRCQTIWVADPAHLPWQLATPALRHFGVRTTNVKETKLFVQPTVPPNVDELHIDVGHSTRSTEHTFLAPSELGVKYLTITMRQCRSSNCLDFSSSFLQLQRLILNNATPGEISGHDTPRVELSFPALEVLKIPHFLDLEWVRSFPAPNLAHLHVDTQQLASWAFTQSNFPNLRSLSVTSPTTSVAPLMGSYINFLQRHPTIQRFGVSVDAGRNFDPTLKLLHALRRLESGQQTEETVVLPLLHTFAIFFGALTPRFVTQDLPPAVQLLEEIKSSRGGAVSILLARPKTTFIPQAAWAKMEGLEWTDGDDVVDFCPDDWDT